VATGIPWASAAQWRQSRYIPPPSRLPRDASLLLHHHLHHHFNLLLHVFLLLLPSFRGECILLLTLRSASSRQGREGRGCQGAWPCADTFFAVPRCLNPKPQTLKLELNRDYKSQQSLVPKPYSVGRVRTHFLPCLSVHYQNPNTLALKPNPEC